MTKSLGIELSDSMVRVAVVERKGKATRILGYFENVIPGDEKTPWPQRADPILKDLFTRGKVPVAVAVASVDSGEVMTRIVSVPFKDDNQIRKTLTGELETHLTNVSAEDIVADYEKLGESDRGSTLLTAAVPKELLAARLAALEAVGVEPMRVELDLEGILFALAHAGGLDGEEPVLVVHGSPKYAKLILVEGKRAKNVRTIRFSLPEPGQETQRRNRSKDTRAFGGPVPLIILSAEEPNIESIAVDTRQQMLLVLAKEIQRFMMAAGQAKAPVEIILSGEFESAAVGRALQQALKIPVRLVNILKGIEHPFDKPELQASARRKILTPLGLALRALTPDARGMDFRQEEYAYAGRAEAAAGTFLVTLELLLVLIAAFGLARYLELKDLRKELGSVESLTEELVEHAMGTDVAGDPEAAFKEWVATEMARRGKSDHPLPKSMLEHLCQVMGVVSNYAGEQIGRRPQKFFLEIRQFDADVEQGSLQFAGVCHTPTVYEDLVRRLQELGYKGASILSSNFDERQGGHLFTIRAPLKEEKAP